MRDAIYVNGEELSEVLKSTDPKACLDTRTGEIVPMGDCPRDETGFGRPAVTEGKRFIQIPSMDELHPEKYLQFRAGADPYERVDADHREFCEVNDEILAAESIALSWLKSLRLPCRVCWLDDALDGLHGNVLRALEPGLGDWQDVGGAR